MTVKWTEIHPSQNLFPLAQARKARSWGLKLYVKYTARGVVSEYGVGSVRSCPHDWGQTDHITSDPGNKHRQRAFASGQTCLLIPPCSVHSSFIDSKDIGLGFGQAFCPSKPNALLIVLLAWLNTETPD